MIYTTLINATDLNAEKSNDNWIILDCRFSLSDPEAGLIAYRQGHIPGAQFADLEKHLSSAIGPSSGRHPLPDVEALATQLGRWGISANTQVIVYDDLGGAMAARCWWLLRWLGHEHVAVLDGGLQAWETLELPLAHTEQPAPANPPYPIALQEDWLITTAQITDNLKNAAYTLVDARSSERFKGLQEPIDPVAGHVPGAVNRPMGDNLTADGTFKSANDLHKEWEALLNGKPCIAMCGSGVTACHNLLSLEIAGISGGKLYAGSWSEWIRDPNRPVSRD